MAAAGPLLLAMPRQPLLGATAVILEQGGFGVWSGRPVVYAVNLLKLLLLSWLLLLALAALQVSVAWRCSCVGPAGRAGLPTRRRCGKALGVRAQHRNCRHTAVSGRRRPGVRDVWFSTWQLKTLPLPICCMFDTANARGYLHTMQGKDPGLP